VLGRLPKASGRLGTLPSAEDVPSLAELARWSSPQPAEPIMATMWPGRYSAAATVPNYRPQGREPARAFCSATFHGLLSAAYPQHTHSIPTGPILGMREWQHGLAAQPFTQAQKTRRVESAGLSSDRGVNFGPATIDKRLFRGP
jgi:hypothetical protein